MTEEFHVDCPYCGRPAEWVDNAVIYGTSRGQYSKMWICRPCDARVGCHKNTMRPLGTMANAQLRAWRMRTHRAIDRLWTGATGRMTRAEMYRRLSVALGHEVHVAWADEEECEKIIEAAKKI
jgi:hypothetical protein